MQAKGEMLYIEQQSPHGFRMALKFFRSSIASGLRVICVSCINTQLSGSIGRPRFCGLKPQSQALICNVAQADADDSAS